MSSLAGRSSSTLGANGTEPLSSTDARILHHLLFVSTGHSNGYQQTPSNVPTAEKTELDSIVH